MSKVFGKVPMRLLGVKKLDTLGDGQASVALAPEEDVGIIWKQIKSYGHSKSYQSKI
jgi:hypothetical protein